MHILFFNDTATTEIYTLSLRDALPIWLDYTALPATPLTFAPGETTKTVQVQVTGDTRKELPESFTLALQAPTGATRSEEHTSELQSRQYLVCRLLLEQNNKELPRS